MHSRQSNGPRLGVPAQRAIGFVLLLFVGAAARATLPCMDAAAPIITAPSYVLPGSVGSASAPLVANSTYQWEVQGGSITSGQGSRQISFSAGPAGTVMLLRVIEMKANGCVTEEVRRKVLVDFTDVIVDNYHDYIVSAATLGVMPGCVPGQFCPSAPITRAQMAYILLRSEHGGDYIPPPAVGVFSDVPVGSPDAPWIEQLYNEGVTAGCDVNPLRYCPTASLTRAQMAVFILKAEYTAGYTPPSCTGLFGDVPCPGGNSVDWIEQLSREGVTAGCGGGNYCPTVPIPANQMSVFTGKAFGTTEAAVLWYLDDAIPTATTTIDFAGNGNTGILSAPTTTIGVTGYAKQFHPNLLTWIYSNSTPSVTISGPITIEAWIKPTGAGAQRIVNKAPNTGSAQTAPGNFDVYLDSARHVVFAHESTAGTKTYASTGTVPLNSWTHVAATWGGGRVRLYITGALNTDLPDVGETALTNSPFVRIGRKSDGGKFQGETARA